MKITCEDNECESLKKHKGRSQERWFTRRSKSVQTFHITFNSDTLTDHRPSSQAVLTERTSEWTESRRAIVTLHSRDLVYTQVCVCMYNIKSEAQVCESGRQGDSAHLVWLKDVSACGSQPASLSHLHLCGLVVLWCPAFSPCDAGKRVWLTPNV